MTQVQLEVPEGTVAVVLLHHIDGGLVARYAEHNNAVPAPREHVARTLRMLAEQLEAEAAAMGDSL